MSVVIVTIPGSDIQVSRALALGCSGYLLETLDGPALRKAIRDIARGECVIEPGLLRDLLTGLTREVGTRRAQVSQELDTVTGFEFDLFAVHADNEVALDNPAHLIFIVRVLGIKFTRRIAPGVAPEAFILDHSPDEIKAR